MNFLILLALLFAVALVFILVPLLRPVASEGGDRANFNTRLYRDALKELEQRFGAGEIEQDDYESRVQELEARLVEDSQAATVAATNSVSKAVPLVLAGLFLVATFATYQYLGSYQQWQLDKRYRALNAEGADAETLEGFLQELQQYAQGRDQSEWLFVLAQGHMQVRDYQSAADAFGRLARLHPEDADMLARYAQALYLARGRSLDTQVRSLVDQALALNPHQTTVLGMLGIHAFENRLYEQAIAAWEKALAGMPPMSPNRQLFEDGIRQAREMSGESVEQAPPAGAAPLASADAAGGFAQGIRVRVSAGDAVEASAGDTVFVLARSPAGGPPLAIARLTVADLPVELLLDDSTAMLPGQNLSSNAQVRVTARISRSGNARPQPGDWQAQSGVLSPESLPSVVELVISQAL